MARVAVDVVIKAEILDPQGKAILAALVRIGHHGIASVRQGKHFDLEVDDSVSDDDLEEIAGSLLANPVIESWTVTRLEGPGPGRSGTGQSGFGQSGFGQSGSGQSVTGQSVTGQSVTGDAGRGGANSDGVGSGEVGL